MLVGTHRPDPARVVPTATYRLQVHGGFGFEDAAERVPYLADLGVSHVYLSPVLQPAPGSTHGYDVLDHTRISEEAGGRAGFQRLVEACREHGLGLVVDVVPNHMAVPSPEHLNAPFWALLREGRRSPYAGWFDVDWLAEDERILMPVLGATLERVLERGELVLADDGGPNATEHVLRYYDHEFPVMPGTESLPLTELVEAQAYRLSSWREGDALNYRRFFDVTSLVAVRVEDPVVFTATHALLLALHGHGEVDGFRIDHPDGLADPGGYLARLAESTGDAWVVVEKILEGQERLPDSWRCAGTTGYDALLRVQQVLTPPDRTGTLDRLWAEVAPDLVDLDDVVTASKRLVVDDVQAAEVDRLMRLVTRIVTAENAGSLRRALEALLVSMDRYRAYVSASGGDPAQVAVVDAAAERARRLLAPSDEDSLEVIHRLVVGGPLPDQVVDTNALREEFMRRFEQTCGPVMAKGIEDTAFYRWFRLAGANEVGGHPQQPSIDVEAFHAWCLRQQAEWPTSMTTLTTHDTKRSEDTRARLMVLAEDAEGWERWLEQARRLADPHRTPRVDPVTEYLVWQTLVGTWPITGARLEQYLLKAVREAKVHTAWIDGDSEYEEEVVAFARAVGRDLAVHAHLDAWTVPHEPSVRATILGQKLVQLTMPGVPDVFQGCEIGRLAVVDPDNRRPVDWADRALRLSRVLEDEPCFDLDDDKIRVTALALRLRREHPEAFVGEGAEYTPVATGTEHALAFARGDADGPRALTVVTRAAGRLAEAGGFGDAAVAVPPGRWREVLSGREQAGDATVALAELLADRPVALLVRQDEEPAGDLSDAPVDRESVVSAPAIEVWAPDPGRVEIQWSPVGAATGARREPMTVLPGGWWRWELPSGVAQVDYAFVLDGEEPALPDPRSAWLPSSVHGPSRTLDTSAFPWTDGAWRGPRDGAGSLGALFYELHVGTFTAEGTFDAAAAHLDHLVALGVDVVELMPVAAFPTDRGWGYDGVGLYAVQESYGGPAGLARFVDACHARGLGVCLDVVHNHLGASGNYLARFGPYFTEAHETPWGPAVNLDHDGSGVVRGFLLDSVRRWFRDFHVDALRLDAVHQLKDDSPRHYLAELSDVVSALAADLGRPLDLVAESDLNDTTMVAPTAEGGRGMTAQWNDDVHHALHVALTGETQGYYADFGGTSGTPERTPLAVLAKVLTHGFLHDGSWSSFRGRNWGAPVDAVHLDARRLLGYLQTHDQVGNRATGERISALVADPGLQATGAALYLLAPTTPMLFMGEEWAASTPWQFFTSFEEDWLVDAVRNGRRAEFGGHGWVAEHVPDPQDRATRDRSVLDWSEPGREGHARMLAWYTACTRLRRELVGGGPTRLADTTAAFDDGARWFTLARRPERGRAYAVLANLGPDPCEVPLDGVGALLLAWEPEHTARTAAGVRVPARAVAVVDLAAR